VHVDVGGTVRLTDWALAGISGEERSPARLQADLRSLAVLVRRLVRAAGGAPRSGQAEASHALEQFEELVALEWDGVEDLLRAARRRGAFLPDETVRAAAAAQLGQLSAALGGMVPQGRAPLPPRRPPTAGRARWIRSRPAGARRPRGRRGLRALALCGLAVVALAGLAAWRGGLPNQVGRPQVPSLSLPHSTSPSPTTRPSPSGQPAVAPSSAPGLRPVPSQGPPAAGGVSRIDLQALQPGCAAGSSCPVRVTVWLAPQPQAQVVAWTFDLFDRCSGAHVTAPGGSVTALAEWPYVYQTTWVQTPAGHPLAAVAVSSSPARVASQPLPVDGTRSC
jgi:hypothetical protein